MAIRYARSGGAHIAYDTMGSGPIVNTTGDGFVATFDAPSAAVRAARAILGATGAASS